MQKRSLTPCVPEYAPTAPSREREGTRADHGPRPSPSAPASELCPTCREDPRAASGRPALGPSTTAPPTSPRLNPAGRAPPPAACPQSGARPRPHLTYPLSGAGLYLPLRHVGPRSEPRRLPARRPRPLSAPAHTADTALHSRRSGPLRRRWA